MAHQASYRVYRPRRFSEVMGQARTITTLREAVRQGRLTHAYLFSGPRGTGKTSVARILAKAVNCENLEADGDPCLACASCRSVEAGQHLDVIEIDAASNRGIDEIRDIKERITHQTAMSRFKVYIIDEVHMLTQDAFNALLKTLEEPPAHVLFVLATTEAHKLPVTVLSRCQRYEFKRLTLPIIEERLRYVAQQEGVECQPEGLELLAEAADGALRDALSLFDQIVASDGAITSEGVARIAGLVGHRQMQRLVEALATGIEPVVQVLAELRHDGIDEKLILRDLARQFRDVLLYRTAGADLFPPYRRDGIAKLSQEMPDNLAPTWWIESANQLAEAEVRLKGGFPADLAVELAILKVQNQLLHPAVVDRPVEGHSAPQRSAAAPSVSAPAPAAAPPSPSEPDEKTPAPESLVAPHEQSFAAVLEAVKRDRPSTHALLEKAEGEVLSPDVLKIWFEFPAHREIAQQTHNRDVVERAVKAVFGSAMRVEYGAGKPTAAVEPGTAGAPAPSSQPPLADAVRDWFGPDIPLKGF